VGSDERVHAGKMSWSSSLEDRRKAAASQQQQGGGGMRRSSSASHTPDTTLSNVLSHAGARQTIPDATNGGNGNVGNSGKDDSGLGTWAGRQRVLTVPPPPQPQPQELQPSSEAQALEGQMDGDPSTSLPMGAQHGRRESRGSRETGGAMEGVTSSINIARPSSGNDLATAGSSGNEDDMRNAAWRWRFTRKWQVRGGAGTCGRPPLVAVLIIGL
jgi:hypothetical protein